MDAKTKYQLEQRLKYDQSYKANLYRYCKQSLNESRHIVTEFNDVAKWLKDNITLFEIDKMTYSGWNWHIASKQCLNDKNEHSGYPIYVVVDSTLPNEEFAYIEHRDVVYSSIVLHINVKMIDCDDIESKLNHEFTHIKTTYSNFFKNSLEDKKIQYDIKDLIYYIDYKSKKYSFKYFNGSAARYLFRQHFDTAKACLYYMSETEQDARINQIYKYIVQKYDNTSVLNRSVLLNEVNSISLLSDFIEMFEMVDNCSNSNAYRKTLCLSYYLNKLGCIHYEHLDDNTMLQYFNIVDGLKQEFASYFVFILNRTVDYMRNSLIKYEQRVQFIIDDAIYDIKQNTIK